MYTWPGKKLLFMGAEFAQRDEWDCQKSLDWQLMGSDRHQGVTRLVTDLNYLYRRHSALYYYDFETRGFQWVECHDGQQSVLSYQRKSAFEVIIVVLNFTPEPRYDYRIGIPDEGIYRELVNSDSEFYAGSNMGNTGLVHSEAKAWMDQPHSLVLLLPPLAGIVLTRLNGDAL